MVADRTDPHTYFCGYVLPDPGTGSMGNGGHGFLDQPPVVYPNYLDGQTHAAQVPTAMLVLFQQIEVLDAEETK